MKPHPYADTPQYAQAYRKPLVRDLSDPQERDFDPARLREEEHSTFVYFIQAGAGGPVKIGTSNDVEKRLGMLQTGNAERLSLLLKIPGATATEARLHQRFADVRISGEWFKSTPELLAFIDDPEDVLRDVAA